MMTNEIRKKEKWLVIMLLGEEIWSSDKFLTFQEEVIIIFYILRIISYFAAIL